MGGWYKKWGTGIIHYFAPLGYGNYWGGVRTVITGVGPPGVRIRQLIVNEADSLFTPTGFPFRPPPAVPHDFWFLGYYMKA